MEMANEESVNVNDPDEDVPGDDSGIGEPERPEADPGDAVEEPEG